MRLRRTRDHYIAAVLEHLDAEAAELAEAELRAREALAEPEYEPEDGRYPPPDW